MRPSLEIKPFVGKLDASIRPPGSKSITNRALLCAALAEGQSRLSGALDSDDCRVMIDSLKETGIAFNQTEIGGEILVDGSGGQLHSNTAGVTEMFVGNSGTTMRFLTAACAMGGGNFRLSGVERMHQRPIRDLVNALKQIGTTIGTENHDDCPPVQIKGGRSGGGVLRVRGDISSQYLSGLMMAAPLASGKIEIQVEGNLISRPYVSMTQAVMKSFGVDCSANVTFDRFVVEAGQTYKACDYSIEPDASAASYFWGAAAICGGTVKVLGLNQNSLQGDIGFAKCLADMGCKLKLEDDGISITGPATTSLELDMSDISDTVQTLAAVALFVPGSTSVRGVAHNRVKETDRIGNLAIELRKLGATVDELEDGLVIHPGLIRGAEIKTYDDHRMAMSLSLVGLKQPGIIILDPDCCSKTYPDFFLDLESIRPK